LWTIQLEGLPSGALRETVQEIEALGWPALWIPETFGREALSASTLLLMQPRMLALSAEKAAGAHTYLVTPEHTATAREILGPKPVLAPEQMVILHDDPTEARRIARLYLARYLAQPNYQNSLRRLGFTDDDFEGDGTDKLIDALVAWGDEGAILKRLQAHRDAGADHVCVQPVADPSQGFPIASIRRLSEALLPTPCVSPERVGG
jgi:probable F420-dependent oxidoreductase